jgi:hypothetical protein
MRIKKSTYFEPLWLGMSTNTIILIREIFDLNTYLSTLACACVL